MKKLSTTLGSLCLLSTACPAPGATSSSSADPPDTSAATTTGTTDAATSTDATTAALPTTGATETGTTASTSEETGASAVCGNGVVEAGEACDEGEDNGPGAPCSEVCQPSAVCGDGVLDPSEGCDDGNQDDDDACSNACVLATCGDGELARGEQCDDGNADDTDACKSNCTHASCGDGVVQAAIGEQCDEGPGNADDAACTAACQTATCGDGLLQRGVEQCDDGADNGPGESCTAACALNVCGDGDKGPGEDCDDGDDDPDDGCDSCQLTSCGDRKLDDGEACDDGQNGDPDDGCTDDCALPACGDGFVQPSLGEQCDKGDSNNDIGACTFACKQAVCGDGLIHQGVEECDLGDNGPGKVCRAGCTHNVCGDGDASPAEACDDGNLVAGDGCSALCKQETTLDCDLLLGSEPIVLDDYTQTDGALWMPPTAMLWRDELVLARAERGPGNACDAVWERRDAAGQLLAPPVLIDMPFPPGDTNDPDTCTLIGDLGWDPAREQYIFVHPQKGPGWIFSGAAAISPTGELLWVNQNQQRSASYNGGTVSQIRVVDDSVFVLGHDQVTVQKGATMFQYDASDGALIGATRRGIGAYTSAIACDAACTAGIALYALNGPLSMDDFPFGPVTQLAPGFPNIHYSLGMLWRGGNSYLATSVQYTPGGSSFRSHLLTSGAGSTLVDAIATGTDVSLEPAILEIDDGYLVAASTYPYPDTNVKLPSDLRDIRVQGWNLAHDGTIRGTFEPPEHGHSPRLAYRGGKVALTYVHLQSQQEAFESRKLMFFECPR